MTFNLPTKYRVGLYLFTAVVSPIVAYALAKGWIGDLEVALWTAEVTVASGLAALNVNTGGDHRL